MVLSEGVTGVVRSATGGVVVDGVVPDVGVVTPLVGVVTPLVVRAGVPRAGTALVSVVTVVLVVSDAGDSAGRLSPQATTPSVHTTANNAFFIGSLLRIRSAPP
jgi:hypothetical protein